MIKCIEKHKSYSSDILLCVRLACKAKLLDCEVMPKYLGTKVATLVLPFHFEPPKCANKVRFNYVRPNGACKYNQSVAGMRWSRETDTLTPRHTHDVGASLLLTSCLATGCHLEIHELPHARATGCSAPLCCPDSFPGQKTGSSGTWLSNSQTMNGQSRFLSLLFVSISAMSPANCVRRQFISITSSSCPPPVAGKERAPTSV